MAKTLKRFDQQVYKFKPDQMVLRLNDMVDAINGQTLSFEQVDSTPNSNFVIVYGRQPDGSFGIAKWTKLGDQYTNKTVVV